MILGQETKVEFVASDQIKNLGLKGAFFVMDFDPSKSDAAKSTALLREATYRIRAEEPNISADPILSGFRDLHTKVGVSNRKHVSSPENLISLVLAGRELPSINAIVDIYNAVSLQTKLALGAHDISKIVGPIALRLTDGSESFTPLGSLEQKVIATGEYGYIDEGNNQVICRLETRQCQKTKVDTSTRSCFFIVEGNSQTDEDYTRRSTEDLQRLLVSYCGGVPTNKVYWLT